MGVSSRHTAMQLTGFAAPPSGLEIDCTHVEVHRRGSSPTAIQAVMVGIVGGKPM